MIKAFLLSLLLLVAQWCDAACTVVQTSNSASAFPNDGSANSTTVTFPGAITAGNHVIVVFGGRNTGGSNFASPTASDGTGYTLADLATYTDTQTAGSAIFYRANHPGGSITVTVTPGAFFVTGRAMAVEVSGLQNTAPEVGTKLQAEIATVSASKTGGFTVNNICVFSTLGVYSGTNLTFTTPATIGGSSGTNIGNDKNASDTAHYSFDYRSITNGTSGTITSTHGSLDGGTPYRSGMTIVGFLETTATTRVNPITGRGGTAAQPLVH